MHRIEYPKHDFRIKEEKNGVYIFDEVRKKWIILTPEEWVRQNFVQYLIQVKKYPASLIAIEKEIKLGELKKRCDIVVYKQNKPWMIVECKEPKVALKNEVIQQILRYNITLKGQVLVITNGKSNYVLSIKDGKIKVLENLPDWLADNKSD